MNIDVKLLTATARLPQRMSDGAAGYDLYADNAEDIVIKARQWALVPTGIAVAIPSGFEGQVRPRSGLAAKHGITVLNSPGTIDSDYRGEVKVVLMNHSDSDFVVTMGSRIAQLVVARCESAEFNAVESLSQTAREDGGFGHTGEELGMRNEE